MQRVELASVDDGIVAIWTTGRTDRRDNKRPRGRATARVAFKGLAAEVIPFESRVTSVVENGTKGLSQSRTDRSTEKIGDTSYQLFYGDLHRHTDFSLCRAPIDGTIDDAYRYASDIVQLDFLGITDHARDIAQGNALSQLWWRSGKEVSRYRLGTMFFPFFAYERSRGDTSDHNVISLRDDMLRPHTYPLHVFWNELDQKTMTIPHQHIGRQTWQFHNDALRPLIEIYQGCRDAEIESHAQKGLGEGHHIGFIASSDHMSTSASYACVWAPEASRESIFLAMQARRTYAATAKIQLAVRAGDHWMGEKAKFARMPPLEVNIQGTAPIRAVTVVVDGKPQKSFTPDGREVKLRVPLQLVGKHYVYVRVLQRDGNRTWSSPIWVDVATPK